MTHPEWWLRGVALDPHPLRHLLLCTFGQAKEESARAVAEAGEAKLWLRPFDLGPLGFHIRHLAESTDRLLSYAEGRSLSEEQLARLRQELHEELPWPALEEILHARLAPARLLALDLSDLSLPRSIGRARIPVPLGTLLGHIAEHTQRHLGQIATLRRLLPHL